MHPVPKRYDDTSTMRGPDSSLATTCGLSSGVVCAIDRSFRSSLAGAETTTTQKTDKIEIKIVGGNLK
jgi:hypothetical protein